MKSVLFLISFFYFITATPFYDLQFSALDGSQISMFQFNKKKIMIVPFDNHTCSAQLLQLDSLQKINSNIQIIVTPALDLGCYSTTDSLRSFKDSLGLTLLMSQPMYVKRGANQDTVYQWLTQVSENNHFDNDVHQVGTLFIIGENGDLYAVVEQNLSINDIVSLLNAKSPDY